MFPFDTEPFPPNGIPSTIDQPGVFPEQDIPLPWVVAAENTWIDYRCWVEVELDAGMALHKPLPQQASPVDTLASVFLDGSDFASSVGGVNLQSKSQAVDIIQRMATSTYTYILRGWALRVAYQIPVPGAVKLADGTPLTPMGRQWSLGNAIVGNLPGGIPVFYNQWELRYQAVRSPKTKTAPIPANPALHIGPDAQLPEKIQWPTTPVDDRINNPTESLELPTAIEGG